MSTKRAVPTIASIAEEAGVSVPTVSKVLNGRPGVAPATRARVEEALARREFRRSNRGPATAPQTPLLDLAFHELGSPWSLEVICGVEEAAAAAGIAVVVSEFGGSHRPQQDWLDAVLTRRPVGVLLALSSLGAHQRHQLESRSIPFVVLDNEGDLPSDVPIVGSNNWSGGLQATRHLIELGHRRIAMISGPEAVLCSRARVAGYRSALAEAGLPADPALIRYGTFMLDAGYAHARELLTAPEPPTAIFAGSDLQAIGALRAINDIGLRTPRDVSVIGYDNLPQSEWTIPSLSTVNQPLKEMAAAATRMLVHLGRGETPALQRIDLATDLVVRESTAPPLTTPPPTAPPPTERH